VVNIDTPADLRQAIEDLSWSVDAPAILKQSERTARQDAPISATLSNQFNSALSVPNVDNEIAVVRRIASQLADELAFAQANAFSTAIRMGIIEQQGPGSDLGIAFDLSQACDGAKMLADGGTNVTSKLAHEIATDIAATRRGDHTRHLAVELGIAKDLLALDWAGSMLYGLVAFASGASRQAAEPEQCDPVTNEQPTRKLIDDFMSRLEPIVYEAERGIHDGWFDHDDNLRRRMERDARYVRDEAIDADAKEQWLGSAIGNIVARIERAILLYKPDMTDEARDLAAPFVDALTIDQGTGINAVIDTIVANARLDDSDWLAKQVDFDRYADEIEEIRATGAKAWLIKYLGWHQSDQGKDFREDVRGTVPIYAAVAGAVGGTFGAGIGLITDATITVGMGAGTPIGISIGTVITVGLSWLATNWKHRPNDSAEVDNAPEALR